MLPSSVELAESLTADAKLAYSLTAIASPKSPTRKTVADKVCDGFVM